MNTYPGSDETDPEKVCVQINWRFKNVIYIMLYI